MNAIVDRLLQFLEMEKDYVTAEALVMIMSVFGLLDNLIVELYKNIDDSMGFSFFRYL